MSKVPMPHLLIFLPGIMGSVLQKDGRDVWALSGQALAGYVTSLGRVLESLRVSGDDGEVPDLGDGIQATRLIEDIHAIPGLMEHAGYSVIVRQLQATFDVETGSILQPRDSANFYPFPYDWRRDNRATALKLKTFVDAQLPRWRKHSGADNAQVILIGHSMGGLVARYYLEALEGWRNCHTVITIGSPHRGAVGALNTLSNGVSQWLPSLSTLVRSFQSAYQLLPAYRAVQVGADFKRVTELEAVPNLDLTRARQARADFLQATVDAARRNANVPGYRQCLMPWVGVRQGTAQSAELREGRLTVSKTPPAGLSAYLADGDGTVPRVSATPVDLDGRGLERFSVERHSWLTNNPMTLSPLLETLIQQVSPDASEFFGGLSGGLSGLSLSLEPLYAHAEPVTVDVQLVADDATEHAAEVKLEIALKGGSGQVVTRTVQATAVEARRVTIDGLAPGLYQLTASASVDSQLLAAHGIFEIIDPALLG